ncbi:methionyl-tRNA formyltransferase [Balneola sp. MJW-20]|uniref:methionyl-tRNA formyltransferase n=1 Tax=Gracilimonas aurantiaca TaxID=3234185 RepID=UPI0034677807
MKIVFMGSPDFAIPSLEKLVDSQHEILAVVSNPDKRRGRGSSTSPTPLKAKALELGLPTIDVEDLRSAEFEESLQNLNADLFVVVAFRILPVNILEIPKIGSVNLHASLLPKYRGAAPIHHAVMEGETETGCTIFFLDEKVDTGNIILQAKTPIGENETTGEVYNRLKKEGSELLLEAVDLIANGEPPLNPQDDTLATPAPKIFRDDCRIDFDQKAKKVHNKIRGLSPFPTAWTTWNGKKFNIYRSKLGPGVQADPGEILIKEGKLLVACKDGSVELIEVQLPGTKVMSAEDFMNGHEVEETVFI